VGLIAIHRYVAVTKSLTTNTALSLIVLATFLTPTLSYAATQTTERTSHDSAVRESDINSEQTTNTIDATAIPKPVTTASAIGAEVFNPNTNLSQQELNTISGDPNSLRLLEIHIGKYMLEDLLAAYQREDMILIPVGALSEYLDIAIDVDTNSGIAKGFIYSEDRSFYLDVKRGEVTVAGKLTQFNKRQAAIREFDDIYIDSNLLGDWFLMKLDIDLFNSQLKIVSKYPLPFEKRKQREERFKMIQSRQASDRGYPMQDFPYQAWSYPFVNQTLRLGVLRDTDGHFDGTYNYSTYVTADLMNLESTWYAAGNKQDTVQDSRVTFAKHDPNGTLLGQLRATEYAFGNVNEPRNNLITQPLDPQVGVTVSNYPLTRQLQYDSHSFRGDLPPGWEVELYRNNILLDYIAIGKNGQYQFDDVPLLFGSNYFRLVFYGPQGQQREEIYNFTLDRSLSEPGKHYYRALISKADGGGNRALAQYDFGFNKNLSFAASATSIPLAKNYLTPSITENHNYVAGGLRGFYKALFYRSDIIVDEQSGTALDWNTQSRISEVILNIGETYFQNDFVSEQFLPSYQLITRRSTIKIDTAITPASLPRIPINFEMERKAYQQNLVATRYSNRISMQQHAFSISNTLNRNEQTGLKTTNTGTLQVSKHAYGYNFRGSMSYQISPNSELSATTFTMDGIKWRDYHISTGVSHVTQNNINEIFFNMSRALGAYSLGASARYATGGIFALDMTFSISLGREPRSGNWVPEYRPIASQGAMSIQVFVDENNNGIKDPNEKGIEGAKININGSNFKQVANADGIIFVTGIEPYRELDIDVAVESLRDPLWQSAVKGKRVSLRPGYAAQIDFPVIITGEIDGTASVKLGSEQREVSGVVIELVNLEGKVLQTAKTAYDGFYLFSKIPTGKYQVRVSRDQTDALGLQPVKPTFVVIDASNPIVNGMDFVLQKR